MPIPEPITDRRRSPEDVTFNNASLRAVDSKIISVRLLEEAPEVTTQYGHRAAMDGQMLLSHRRDKKTLAVEFAVNVLYDYAAKVQILDKVNAWARSAESGYLAASTQTNKKIMVRCSKFAVPSDAWVYDTKYRVEFETLGTPYWIDKTSQSLPSQTGTDATFTFSKSGNHPSPLSGSITFSSSNAHYLLIRKNIDTSQGLVYKNYFSGTWEDGTISNSGQDEPSAIGNRVRSVGYTELPAGVYKVVTEYDRPYIMQYWACVYNGSTKEYLPSESSLNWVDEDIPFAVGNNRVIRMVWRDNSGIPSLELEAQHITEVKIEDQTEHCESAMAFISTGINGIVMAYDYINGIPSISATVGNQSVNPWVLLTDNSSDIMWITPGASDVFKFNSDASGTFTVSTEGWYV